MENEATELRNQIQTLGNSLPLKLDKFKISQRQLADPKQQMDHGSAPGTCSGRSSFRGLAFPVRWFKHRRAEKAPRAFARAGALAVFAGLRCHLGNRGLIPGPWLGP
jgi:hypothetical protein